MSGKLRILGHSDFIDNKQNDDDLLTMSIEHIESVRKNTSVFSFNLKCA